MQANPFIAIQAGLRSSLKRHKLPTEDLQLQIISVLLGLSLVISLIALTLRIRSKSFWLFRKVDGGYLLPAGSNNWLLLSILVALFGQAYIYKPEANSNNLIFVDVIDTLTWGPVWIGRWILTWATSVAAIQVMQRTSTRVIFFNLFFISIPILGLVLAVIFQVFFEKSHIIAYRAFEIIDQQLTIAIDQVNNGTYIPSPEIEIGLGDVITKFTLFQSWAYILVIHWMVMVVIESLLFIAVSIVYLRTIFKSMQRVNQHQSSFTGSGKMISLSKEIKGLIFSTILSFFVSIAHVAADCYLVSGAFSVRGEYWELIVLWGYVIFGACLGSIAILVRSFDRSTTNQPILTTPTSFFQSKVIYQVELDRVEEDLELCALTKKEKQQV